jgi:[acyl-carrier-protein] S-malonyltransferase
MLEIQKAQAKLLVIVAPGQGAQTPGMFDAWLSDERFASVVGRASDVTGLDLKRLGTVAETEEIKQTKFAQPLLVTSALGAFACIEPHLNLPEATLIAGHSVGEIAALHIGDVISMNDAFRLVATRAHAMHEATLLEDTAMAAVLGGNRDDVIAHLATLNLVAANENGAGQIVAAGAKAGIDSLLENPPVGTRVRSLSVAGAFHTSFMKPAQGEVAELCETLEVNDSRFQMISNKEGALVNDGNELLARIVSQIANPVRWDLCMQSMETVGVTGMIELFPGGTLTSILKRAYPNIETCAITSPEMLQDAVDFALKHSSKLA